MNILSRLIYLFTAAGQGPVASHVFSFVAALEGNFFFQLLKNIALWLFNLILKYIWVIEKFVLGIMEALEYIINTFLGIGSTIDDILGFDAELVDTLVKTFRAILGVAIVLLIIFTIYAIIKQEYANITSENGMSDENNKKGPIVKKMFLSLMAMILLPFVMIMLIGALNSVLTSFNNALKGDKNTTIAGQVLATSTFDTNKYRLYAENNKRVPIIISAYNVDDYKSDETQKLYNRIKSTTVQTKLRNTALNISNDTLLSFNSALSYSNNKLTNSDDYGDYYESFVCTAEQYSVFADFIDYCEISNVPFYIKSVAEEDIEWKYVEQSVFDQDELSLTISYRDANDLSANGSKTDAYTITYSMGYDVTTPISDALNSISTLLGITKDENGNSYTYNEMERDQDSLNIVNWANEKASIHFSEFFDINDMRTWTSTDEILMYEYYHRSTNNTLGDYTLEQLSYQDRGSVTLDVYQILYRDYYPEADAYSSEMAIECVYINGSYYRVVESDFESDGYGNRFYELYKIPLAEGEEGLDYFLSDPYSVLTMVSKYDSDGNIITSGGNKYTQLKFTGKDGSAFDLNDPTTWSYTDQIIMYEYYSNLSMSNSLYLYDITDFSIGVDVPVYEISDYDISKTTQTALASKLYALINGTYYEVTSPESSGRYTLKAVNNSRFLEEVNDDSHVFTKYDYSGTDLDNDNKIVINDPNSRYGISTNTTNKTADDFIIDENDSDHDSIVNGINYVFPEDQEIPELVLHFNTNFDFRDTTTWSFKDYFLFYVYIKYLSSSGYTIASFKTSELSGTVGYVESENRYYFKISQKLTNGRDIFLKIDEINEISNQNMREVIDEEQTYVNNSKFQNTNNELLLTTIYDPNTVFARAETENKTFSFSTGANYEAVSDWKMGDFLLFLLDNNNIIHISQNKNNQLQDYSYNSICYKVKDDSSETPRRLYAFGLERKVYLNEEYILNLDLDGDGTPDFENLDVWLRTSLASYISRYLKLESNIIVNENTLLQGLLDDGDFNSSIYAFNSLLFALIQAYGLKVEDSSKLFEVYNSVQQFEYINTNENFYMDRYNLTEWTALDFIEYIMTGDVTGQFRGYLIIDTAGRRSILMEDGTNRYAVSIENGSFFESELEMSGTITSASVDLGGKSLNEYYNENLKDAVISVLSSENNFYRASNVEYTYSSTSGTRTKLECIVSGLGFGTPKSTYKTYSDGTFNYLYLGSKSGYDYYVQVVSIGADPVALVSETTQINPKRTKTNGSSIFTEDGSYKAFDKGLDTESYSVLDAIILELTGEMQQAEYNIYKLSTGYGNHKYIFVGGQFVEITSDFTTYSLESLNEKLTNDKGSALNDSRAANINMLMKSYYYNLILSKVSEETTTEKKLSYDFSEFDINDVSTWTPLSVILYYEGAMGKEGETKVSGIYKETVSNKKYIEFSIISSTGIKKTVYVDVATLLSEDARLSRDLTADPLAKKDESLDQIEFLRYRIAMSKAEISNVNGDNIVSYLNSSNIIDSYTTFENVVGDLYANNVSSSILHQPISPDNYMEEDDITTWNWIDILYNYFFSLERESNEFVYYTDTTGKIYLGLTNGTTTIFIKFNESILSSSKPQVDNFSSGTEDVSFSLTGTDNSLIGLLYYKYTSETTGIVNYIKLSDSESAPKVYIVYDYINDHKVYVFNAGSETVSFMSTVHEYSYVINAVKDNLSDWTLFDLLIKAATGNTRGNSEVINSRIYEFGGRDYILVNSYYIDISKLKSGLNIPADTSGGSENLVITLKDNASGGAIKVSNLLFASTESGINKPLIEMDESEVVVSKLAEPENEDKPDDGDIKLYFSQGFDFSDYTTWKNSDFVLYYLFTLGQMDQTITNFQYYVNLGYVPASIYYLELTDEYGNISIEKVYKIGGGEYNFGAFNSFVKSIEEYRSEMEPEAFNALISTIFDFQFIREKMWEGQYGRQLTNIQLRSSNPDVDLVATYSLSNDDTHEDFAQDRFAYYIRNTQTPNDFRYQNYYYFVENEGETINSLHVGSEVERQIVDGAYDGTTLVNLKLSNNFDINRTSTWTRLDYIIIREFARGAFKNTEFDELKYDYFQVAYIFGTDDLKYYIKLNGFFYNITDAVVEGTILQNKEEIGVFGSSELQVTKLNTNFVYNFRVLANQHSFVLDKSGDEVTRELIKRDTTLSFPLTITHDGEDKTFTYFREIDNNMASAGIYRVSLTLLDTYTISPLIKKVSWVEKLMNDMQVVYPDLNWANLIANDGWLDTLGEYYSAYASGQYIGTGNSANITAAGMVLSEFLLSIAKISLDGYADYAYTSVFDDSVIRSLMLSLMGEENYNNLVLEAQVFVEMFNVAFAQILDDISYERNIPILDGNENNLTMSVYKSYLATMLLSSDLGEYLYVIATRVLSQYTIYESLAYASGDYSTYYAYINGYLDESGEVVDSFTYGTFQQLVQYENENLRHGAVPTFTFNYADAYRSLVPDREVSDEEIMLSLYDNDSSIVTKYIAQFLGKFGKSIDELLSFLGLGVIKDIGASVLNGLYKVITTLFNIPAPMTFNEVVEKLNDNYKNSYLSYRGCDFSYSGNDSTRFSYLLHVYWSIRQNLYNRKLSTPIYLDLYYDYINNDLDRWTMDSKENINGASNAIQYYGTYKLKLQLNKIAFLFKFPKMYIPDLVVSKIEDDESIEDYVDSIDAVDYTVDMRSVAHRLDLIFESNEVYHNMVKDLFVFNYFCHPIILDKFRILLSSESGNEKSWNTVLNMRDEMEQLLAELSEVMILSPGQKTPNGTSYADFTFEVYNEVYSQLQDLYDSLNAYISTQQTIDMIEKASITFTLAQFSANYVESGFEFSIRNREYCLNTSVSTQRLAEYVYGGEFLSKFGVYAQYTNSEFQGIIRTSKAFDQDDEFVKTKLTSFTTLRQFASKLADYTAKLYFLTNLKDSCENVSDSLELQDSIYCSNSYLNTFLGLGNASIKTSLEYLILDHLVAEEEMSSDTLLRLIFSDTYDSLQKLGCKDEQLIILSEYLEGRKMEPHEAEQFPQDVESKDFVILSLSDKFKKEALRKYLAYVQTTTSNVKIPAIDGGTAKYLSSGEIEGYYGIYSVSGYNDAGVLSDSQSTASDRIHKIFVNVITYLTISEEQREDNEDLGSQGEHVDFDQMNTFQKLKAFLMKSLANYQKNEQETGAENTARFLTLFNLVSGEFNLTIDDGKGDKYIGRTLPSINYYREYDKARVVYVDAEHGNTPYNLSATFRIDRSTRGTILKLCGIENRPIEELVSLEYNELYKRDGNYDEAKGDVFIVCSYDEELGKYIPFLATNRKYSGAFLGTKYMDYVNDYGHNIYTDYYDSPTGTKFAYPIVAKGILTADLKPTAIKTTNNVAEFYRTDITASSEVDENALNRVNAAGETTTIGYVKYVDYTSFLSGQAKNDSKVSFIGSSDITTYVNSGASVYYLQLTSNYSVLKIDEFDGVSVLDDFSSFFKMSFQMHFMMVLGFITLIPLLFKASGAVLRRVLDLIFLVLIGPLCISMNSLSYTDEANKTYTDWKSYLTETLLSVIGLVICFNLYYIMVSTTMNMTFVTEGDATMQKINMVGGLSFVTARLLNGFIKFTFIIVATNMIQTAADMLANMITGGKVKSSFGSPLANGENAIDSIINLKNQVVGDLNNALKTLKDVSSGKILIEAKNALVESLPGSNIVQGVKNAAGSLKNKKEAHDLYKKLRAKGINPITARAYARNFRNNYKKQQKQKQQHRQQLAQSFYGRFGAKANYGK